MDEAILRRQAIRWQRQADAGNLPDEVYEIIAEGAEGLERRQVENLAKESRILTKNGLRKYDDFKLDWRYKTSRFSHGYSTCALCGKYPIREQCILLDEKAEKEITVGNTCVHRYIEIEVDGQTLEGDEKTEFLKTNMKEAKVQFNKAKFASEYPSALSDLKTWEPWMTEKQGWGRRGTPLRKELNSIHRRMVKCLMTKGFPTPKLWREWREFSATAHTQFQEWSDIREQKRIEAERRNREMRERHLRFQEELARKRAARADEADQWREFVKGNNCLSEREMSLCRTIENKLRQGVMTDGLERAKNEFTVKIQIERDEIEISNPVAIEMSRWLETSKLNSWETQFCQSIVVQLTAGKTMSEKQTAAIEKIRKKVGAIA